MSPVVVPALSATVVVPGVPPSWPNLRLHAMARHSQMLEWKQLAWTLAHSARNLARWPLPVRCDPPAPRWLEVDIFRRRLLDQDNAMASIKPLVDGLCWRCHPSGVGPLLVDDSEAWCKWLRLPEQHLVYKPAEERVVLAVYLIDPRQREVDREERRRLAERSEE